MKPTTSLFFCLTFFITSLVASAEPVQNCNGIKSPVEKMICQSADLTRLEKKLIDVYTDAIKKSDTAQIERLKRGHLKWKKARNQCTNNDCIHSHIMNRITALDRYLKN